MNCSSAEPFASQPTRRAFFIGINVLIALFAVVGNALVLLAVIKTPRLHTVSNYFIFSLALADLLVGLVVEPLQAIRASLPQMSGTSTSIACEFFGLQTLMATTMHLAAVSIDRYIAVDKPLHYLNILKESLAWTTISLIWASSTLFSLPSIFVGEKVRMFYWLVTVLITLFIPLGIIFYCYEKIRKISKQHQKEHNRARPTSDTMLRHIKNQKASITFAIIIVVFLICFAPNLISNINYAIDYVPCALLPQYLFWTNTFMFLSSAFNPVIYGARSRDYRMAFKRLIFRFKK